MAAGADSPQAGTGYAGEYRLLYKYLRDRFANRVVLSFAEIEDLLGFSLPESARREQQWGGAVPLTPRATHADAWTRAHRTATVNLAAQSVLFERDAS